MKQIEIIPSILVNSLEEFDERVRAVEPYVKWVQLDVADGDFAPNKTWGDPSQLRDYNTEVLIEAHLMVSEPEKIIDEWLIVRSVRRIYFHYEATNQHKKIIKKIKDAGKEAGIALLSETPIGVIMPFQNQLDAVLIFSGNLGFYGGSANWQGNEEAILTKISTMREYNPDVIIEVDGGMNLENARKVVEAGANVIISGSYIWQHKKGVEEAISELNKSVGNL